MIAVYYAIPNPVSQQVALLSYNTNFSLIWLKPRYFATDVISQSSFSGNRRTQYVPHLQYRQQSTYQQPSYFHSISLLNIQIFNGTNHWQDSNRNSQEPTFTKPQFSFTQAQQEISNSSFQNHKAQLWLPTLPGYCSSKRLTFPTNVHCRKEDQLKGFPFCKTSHHHFHISTLNSYSHA